MTKWYNIACAYCGFTNPVTATESNVKFKCKLCSKVQNSTINELVISKSVIEEPFEFGITEEPLIKTKKKHKNLLTEDEIITYNIKE